MGPYLRRTVEDAVSHDHVVRPDARHHPAEDHAIDDAEGMIRDECERPLRRQDPGRIATEAHIEPEGRDGILPEELRRPLQQAVLLVKAADQGLAGYLLDRPDESL